jgi:hypothetical protein
LNRPTSVTPFAVFLPVLLGICACASSKQSVGVGRVDDLMTRIERMHVEAELAQDKVHAAFDMLQTIATSDFRGDPVEAFAQFTISIDIATKQADALRSSIGPMKKAGEAVFTQWALDLEAFSSATMRERSEVRFRETRRRFGAITALVDPTQEALDAFNLTLKDHAFFLGHDLNAASLAAIEGDVEALGGRLVELDTKLSACQTAARNYVKAAALPGPVNVDATTTTTTPAPVSATEEDVEQETAPQANGRRTRRSAPNTRNYE